MSGHLAAVLAVAAAVWVVRAYFWPYTSCTRCQGRKVSKGSTRKRFGLCGKCGGTGSRQVAGSKAVHRAVRSARSSWSGRKEK